LTDYESCHAGLDPASISLEGALREPSWIAGQARNDIDIDLPKARDIVQLHQQLGRLFSCHCGLDPSWVELGMTRFSCHCGLDPQSRLFTMHEMDYFVYLMASAKNGTLYVGVTNNLTRRVFEHRSGAVKGFTERYRVHRLVWFESTPSIETAIQKEKQIKNWKREWKIALIEKENREWRDLYDALL
jgi:putative endonuclease